MLKHQYHGMTWRVSGALVFMSACGPQQQADRAETASASGQPSTAIGPATPAVFVRECPPCVLYVRDGGPELSLGFVAGSAGGGGRSVRGLVLSRSDRPGWAQRLPASDTAIAPHGGDYLLGAHDLNFDGHADLLLATSRGAANTFADYWLFMTAQEEFRYLGNFPVFTVDSAARRIHTYERGGEAGLVYVSNRYEFRGDSLTLVESERQETTDQAGVYRRTILQLRNGKLDPISSRLVRPTAG